MPKRLLLMVAAALTTLAFFYSLVGLAMACWLSAVPGNTLEYDRLNILFWISTVLLTFALAVWLVIQSIRRKPV